MTHVSEILVGALAAKNYFQASFMRTAKDAVLSVDRWRSERLFLHSNESPEILNQFV
jgi:hypothetical protein